MATYEPVEERLISNGVQFTDPLLGELAPLEMRSAFASEPEPGTSNVAYVSASQIQSSTGVRLIVEEHAEQDSLAVIVTSTRMRPMHVLSLPMREVRGHEDSVLRDLIRLAILGGGTGVLIAKYGASAGGTAMAKRDPMLTAIRRYHNEQGGLRLLPVRDYLWVDDAGVTSALDLRILDDD